MLEEVDVIAAPTVPTTAAPTDQQTITWSDGTVESVSDAYVRLSAPADITGVPSLSVPVGHDRAGVPIGMQFLGRPLGEAVLLRVGHAYEQKAPPATSRPWPDDERAPDRAHPVRLHGPALTGVHQTPMVRPHEEPQRN